MKILKLYCYVDETGQDTKGKLFVVSVVILEEDKEIVEDTILSFEKRFGKRIKWNKLTPEQRIEVMKGLSNMPELLHCVFWSQYHDTIDYRDLTAQTVAKAIASRTKDEYSAYIMIDGATKREEHTIGASLRKLNVKTEKIRGGRDQSYALLRLADAFAGFIRDAIEEQVEAKTLLKKFTKKAFVKEV